jgi:hypothetical protein
MDSNSRRCLLIKSPTDIQYNLPTHVFFMFIPLKDSQTPSNIRSPGTAMSLTTGISSLFGIRI